MKNGKFIGLGIVSALLFVIGAGCAASTPSTTSTNTSADSAPVAAKQKAEVPFSQIKLNVLDAQKDYSEIRFSNLTGDCLDKGLSDNVSYVEDQKLKYFVMKDNGGNFEDDQVGAAFTGQVSFKALTFNQDFVSCIANAPYGADTGAVSCNDANDKPFCTGTYNVSAVPR